MIDIGGKKVALIDAHVHIWDVYKGMRYGDIPVKNLGYGKVELNGEIEKLIPSAFADNSVPWEALEGYMDDNGVDKAVVLQNPCYGDQKEYVADVMKKTDRILATLGKLDPRKTDCVAANIDSLVNEYGCSGVKIEVPDVPFWIDDPEHDGMWRKIVEDDLLVFLDLGFGRTKYDWNIERLEKLLHKYPDIRMRLPHLGISQLWDKSQKYPYPELQKTLALFKINKNNLFVDMTAMPFFDEDGEYPDMRNVEILKTVYETIGPDKIIWGSDFPSVLKLRTLRQVIRFVTIQCTFLSDEDKIKILSGNVLRELRLV
ncbi:MAG: amidohydrolase [Eubacterium sp.]|jgi:predicted TIM-barrel fold metal-dependent hydrolase|nr:amidohydrolase [Eubacterium sp.]